MAKLTDPLHSSEARGRVGGLVYNTWRGIRTVKSHTPPGHEDDPLRAAHFAKLVAAGKRWATISAPERALWELYALQHLTSDWTGAQKRIGGYHWFVRIQVTLQDLGLSYADAPPADIPDFTLDGLQITTLERELDLQWNAPPDSAPGLRFLDLWLAGPHSAGRTPSLHDATRRALADVDNAAYSDPNMPTGIYTAFWRIIKCDGVPQTWQRWPDPLTC